MFRYFVDECQNDLCIVRNEHDLSQMTAARLRPAEEVEIVWKGKLYIAAFLEKSRDQASLRIMREIPANSRNWKLTLIQGLPKHNKLPDLIAQAIEAGADEILLSRTDRSVVKDKSERPERLERICRSAAMQSKSMQIPEVAFRNFDEIDWSSFDQVIFAYEGAGQCPLRSDGTNFAVVIGPEGGFSEAEAAFFQELPNALTYSLGERILRTETAGIALLSILGERLRHPCG